MCWRMSCRVGYTDYLWYLNYTDFSLRVTRECRLNRDGF